jgi:hypothetical protein
MNITLQNRRKKMRFDFIKWFHASIAVLVMMGAGVMFAKADLSDPTLSLYYGFDGDGETVKDGSINGNDGKVVGKVNREGGVYDQAIALETDTWIDMNGPEFKNGPVDGFTLAVWINHTGSGSPQTLLDAIGTDHENGLFHFEIRPAGFRFFHRDGTNTAVFNINPGPVIEGNKWVHFSGTYDSESGDAKTYIDGEETHSAAGTGKLSNNWGVSAGIGHHKNGRWFEGLLDEYYIFGRALPADEISDVMNGTFTAVEPADKLTTTWGSIKSDR